jgi:LPXTG-motif cell wall-anchored protein
MRFRRSWTRTWSVGLGMVVAAAGLTAGTAGAAPAQTPEFLNVKPGSGPTGTTIDIDGYLSCPDVAVGGGINIRFVDPREGFQTGTNLGSVPKQADGSFSGTFTVPSMLAQLQPGVGIFDFPMTPGVHEVQASCSISSTGGVPTIAGDFDVTEVIATTTTTTTTTAPTTTTTTAPFPPAVPPADADDFQGPPPADTPPGGTVVIAEPGFEPGETVVVVLYSDPKVLASVEADVNGEVRIAVALPSDTVPGAHTLVLFGETQVRKAPLNVLALPAQVPGSTASTLPRTGPTRSTGPSTGAGIVLLVVGSGLVVLSSRRRAAA